MQGAVLIGNPLHPLLESKMGQVLETMNVLAVGWAGQFVELSDVYQAAITAPKEIPSPETKTS